MPRSFADVVNDTLPKTVAISAPRPGSFFSPADDDDENDGPDIHGSGVIFDTNGHILTNAHVVNGADLKRLSVLTYDGTWHPATVVASNPQADLAVLKIAPFPGITPVTFGDSTKLRAGETVFAIGAPRALDFSVTRGTISHPDRFNLNWPNGGKQTSATVLPVLQTDASINPGNSGGGLFDAEGNLVGINTFILTAPVVANGRAVATAIGNINLGMALKGNDVRDTANKMLGRTGSAQSNPGLQLAPNTKKTRTSLRPPEATIVALDAGGAAHAAGLQIGDTFVRIGGDATPTANHARWLLLKYSGESVEVVVRRQNAELTLTLSLPLDLPTDDRKGLVQAEND
jgi:putative serine protease PepD